MALVHCPRPLVPRGLDGLDAPGGPREERPQVRLGQAPRVRPRVGVRVAEAADVEPAAGPDLCGVEIKFRAPHAIDATLSPRPRRLDGVEDRG